MVVKDMERGRHCVGDVIVGQFLEIWEFRDGRAAPAGTAYHDDATESVA